MAGFKHFSLIFLGVAILSLGILLFLFPSTHGVHAMQSNQSGFGSPTPTLGMDKSAMMDLYAFAKAPVGQVNQPYITFTAFGNVPQGISVEIRGNINSSVEFSCSSTPCRLLLSTDSVVNFQAFTNSGQVSQEYSAEVRISEPSAGEYMVSEKTSPPEQVFTDRCSAIWGIPGNQPLPGWAEMPSDPSQLNTNETLYYLAGILIRNGVVDVSTCPSGGMANGAPNGCGIEKSRPAIVEWQNKFDLDIWLASNAIGIPAKLLKILLLQESQFWPGNAQNAVAEFGLAQINDMGADVALRWDPDLYQQVCSTVLSNCNMPYMQQPESLRAIVRGALLTQMNAQCLTCKNGLDLNVAHTSIYTIAKVLHAICWDSGKDLSLNNVTAASYEDYWKLTLLSYHSGYYCLDAAIKGTVTAGETIDWQHVSTHLTCPGAAKYVDNFWTALSSFNNIVINPNINEAENANLISTPTLLPTATSTVAIPSPTPLESSALVDVHVYVDKNGNGAPDSSEGVSGASVELVLRTGMSEFGTTDDQGDVLFNLTGRPAGEILTVSLENLYRSQTVILPDNGTVNVFFKFVQPILPPNLP
jgi:hypothetical protein